MERVQIHAWPRPGAGVLAAALLAALAFAGCGGSSASTTTTAAPASTSGAQAPSTPTPATPASGSSKQTSSAAPPPPSISIQLTVLGASSGSEYAIPASNTCDGANTPVSLQWSAIPPHTAELALFIVNLRAVNGAPFIDWAVTGLSPTSHGIIAGKIPSGAVIGRNSFGTSGYSICPPKGKSETYAARIIALPHSLPASSGFDAPTYYQEAESAAKNVGLTGVGTYTRR